MVFCQQCGRQQASAEERFCAACGTAFPASGSPESRSPDSAAPVTQSPATSVFPVAEPLATSVLPAPPAGRTSSRKPFLILAAVVTVIALAAGGFAAWQIFGKSGGAKSPEAAVGTLVSSLQSHDVVALASALDPGEAGGLKNVADTVKSGLSRANSKGANVLSAVSLKLSGVTYSTSSLASGVSAVTITGGTYDLNVDLNKALAALKQSMPSSLAQGLPSTPPRPNVERQGNLLDLFSRANLPSHDIIVVQHDGGWYISVFATAANMAYQKVKQSDPNVPAVDWSKYANPPQAITGSDPAAVIQNLVSAANAHSISQLLANLPQDEVRGLYPFAAFFEYESAKGGRSTDNVRVTNLQFTSAPRDGETAATFTGVTFSSTDGSGNTTTKTIRDNCLITDNGPRCLPAQITSKVGFSGVVLMFKSVNGGYQIDPVATYVNALRAFTAHAVDIEQAIASYFSAAFGALSGGSSSSSSSSPGF